MTKKTAVIFMFIFTLLITSILAGCGGSQAGGGSGGTEGTVSTEKPGSEGGGSAGGTGVVTDQVSPGGSGAGGNGSGSPGGSAPGQNISEIPDINESAVSDWGVANPPEGNTANATASGSSNARTDVSQVVVDRDDLYFAIKEVRADALLGYTWKAYIENRTDKNLMFSFEKVAVNGVMCDPYWAEVVAAGKKGNCEIIWMHDTLGERGITEVTQVDLTLNVYNDDDYMEAPLMHDPFTVYPLGEDKKAAGPAKRQPAESDVVLIDNDDCQIVVTEFDPGNSWGYAVHLYLRNKTEEDLIFSAENTSVNGFMCDPFWAEIVTAGNAAYSTILWDTAALSENGITKVEEISLPLRVYSDKDVANPYVEETFELTP